MKFFIVSDVHSFYEQMRASLLDAGFDESNPMHTFVSLGDLLDRGPMPMNCLKYVNSLERKILIRGNHEDLMEQAIARREFLSHDWHNGTVETGLDLASINSANEATNEVIFERLRNHEEYNKYIKSTVDFYDDGKNVFVHGWIPCSKNDSNMYHANNQIYSSIEDWQHGDWDRARWINGMDAWSQGIRLNNKTIYCGHWHTSWGHCKLHHTSVEFDNPRSTTPEHRKADFSPFVDSGIVALDACTAYSHKVNCYVVETT